MIPVTMHVKSYDSADKVRKSKDFHFGVFVDQKWTPYLMMATLFNSISNLNDFSEEATYRLRGQLQVEGQHRIDLTTMQAPAGTPANVIARLQAETAKAIRDPAMVERVNQLGMIVQEKGTAQYTRFMKDDIERYAAIVRKLNLQIQ